MTHLYDTHYHLDLQKDVNKEVEIIESNHIYTIAVTNLPDLYNKEQNQFDSKYIRLALGFHPELVHEYHHQVRLMWEQLPNARYIGEVGLDFTDIRYKKEQIAFFEQLIDRCREDKNKILTIHSRKAVSTILCIIGDHFKFKPILHWFTGTQKELEMAIESGFYFSINPSMLTSKKALNQIKLIPKNKLLLETDSPFGSSEDHHTSLSIVKERLDSIHEDYLWENFKSIIRE